MHNTKCLYTQKQLQNTWIEINGTAKRSRKIHRCNQRFHYPLHSKWLHKYVYWTLSKFKSSVFMGIIKSRDEAQHCSACLVCIRSLVQSTILGKKPQHCFKMILRNGQSTRMGNTLCKKYSW
jgi:hypothetical protein